MVCRVGVGQWHPWKNLKPPGVLRRLFVGHFARATNTAVANFVGIGFGESTSDDIAFLYLIFLKTTSM